MLDDGSTDNTFEFLEKHYSGLFYFERHTNIGQSATLNKGWSIASGEIIGYLSADDFFHPELVEREVALFSVDKQTVLVCCDNNLVDSGGSKIRTIEMPTADLRGMLCEGICPVAVGALFKRSAYQLIGGWDLAYEQIPDLDFYIKLFKYGLFRRVPQVLASHRVHELSASYRSVSVKRCDEYLVMATRFISEQPELVKHFGVNAILAAANLLSARLQWRSQHYLISVRRLYHAFVLSPKIFYSDKTYRIIFNAIFNKPLHRIRQLVNYFFKD